MPRIVTPTVYFVLLLGLASAAAAQDLDQHLSFFTPLIDKTWVGGYVDHEIEITLHLEAILNGKALRYRRSAAEVDFHAETHFFWDHRRGEVAYLTLNSRGIVERGSAYQEGERIILHGTSQWADRDVDVRWTMELLPDGRLRDTFERRVDDAWVPGHVQEFAPR